MAKKKNTTPPSTNPETDNLLNIFDEHPHIEKIDETISSIDRQIIDKNFETIEKQIDEWNTDQAKKLLNALSNTSPASTIFDTKKQEVEQKISEKIIDISLNNIIELYNQGKYEEAKTKAHKQEINKLKNVKKTHNAISFLDKIWQRCDFQEDRNRSISNNGKYINMKYTRLDWDFVDNTWLDTSNITTSHDQKWIQELKKRLIGKYVVSRVNTSGERWLEIVNKVTFSPKQEQLYEEICSKIDKKLEEKEILNINTSLKEVKKLCKEEKYGEAISLIETIHPKTTEQQKEHTTYIKIIEQNKEKATIQQIKTLRKDLHEGITTTPPESSVAKIETIQKLLENIWDKEILREYMTFPEKDIFLALREAFLAEDEENFLKIYKILLLKPEIINKQINELKTTIKNSPIKDGKIILPKKEIYTILGIHKPLLGFGKIKTDEWNDDEMFISKLCTFNKDIDLWAFWYYLPKTTNINYRSSEWNTLLNIASIKWYTDIIKILLKHPDIEVNTSTSEKKYTPLIRAIEKKDKEIVKLLLQHPDIDVNVIDGDWDAPLPYARKKWYTDIEKLLLAHPKIKT